MSIIATNTTKAQDSKLDYIKSLYNSNPVDAEKRSDNIYWADQRLIDIVNAKLEKNTLKKSKISFYPLRNIYATVSV